MVVERAVPQDEGPSGVVRVGVIGLGSMDSGWLSRCEARASMWQATT